MVVGAVSVLGSSMVVSKTCCTSLYFDPVSSCDFNLTCQNRGLSGKNRLPRLLGSLELRSCSFLDVSSTRALLSVKNLTKRRKKSKSLVVVNELAGQYEDNFDDIKNQIIDYFTYKAVRTVLIQLYEMNPPKYLWFYKYVSSNEQGYGKSFLRELGKVEHSLAERVMVTRLHLYGKWIKECDHAEIYQKISDQNLELMRQRLIETVVWPSDDTEILG